MSRKSFWLGFLLAVAFAIWWLRQQERQVQPAPQRVSPVPPPRHDEPNSDRLEEIAGIGPVFARRLRKAGITTFRQLAMLPEARIRDIVQLQPWQADVASWIEQARERAA